MELQINKDLIRVVILDIDNLYTQIYDEIYCSKEKYKEILIKFNNSDKYKIVVI